MGKYFIITVDTEGDNLWNWDGKSEIKTENSLYIPRFQELCEKYGFLPVYLTNYEMALDDRWVEYSSQKAKEGKCEIGMHIHAWNTPPIYDLESKYTGLPYATEYPIDIIREKIRTLKTLLEERYDAEIKSHRSGRWALSEEYLKALYESGITIDCSVTPQISLKRMPGRTVKFGNDYSKYTKNPNYIYEDMIEIPMSTRLVHRFTQGSWKHRIKNLVFGEDMWLRPIRKGFSDMMYLTRRIESESDTEYLEFMIHSSELMPGGSGYFKEEKDVERLFSDMEKYFEHISKSGYIGVTLSQYAEIIKSRKEEK